MPPASYYEGAVGAYETYHAGTSSQLSWGHRAFLDRLWTGDRPGRALDIGCADGRFLRALQARGWEVCGLDFDRRSIEAARRRSGTAEIHACSVEDAASIFDPQSFDLVTFFEVLEHQTAPAAFVEQVKRLVKPTGVIGGSVPNRDRYIVPTRAAPDLPPHHFTLWNSTVMTRFLEGHGFAHVRTVLARYEPILLDQVIRHLFRRRLEALKAGTGVRSFLAADYDSPANVKGRALTMLRRYVWNPMMAVLTLPEYPVVRLAGRGINLCFAAHLDVPPPRDSARALRRRAPDADVGLIPDRHDERPCARAWSPSRTLDWFPGRPIESQVHGPRDPRPRLFRQSAFKALRILIVPIVVDLVPCGMGLTARVWARRKIRGFASPAAILSVAWPWT
jgi:SAM-dependent methyltransferase